MAKYISPRFWGNYIFYIVLAILGLSFYTICVLIYDENQQWLFQKPLSDLDYPTTLIQPEVIERSTTVVEGVLSRAGVLTDGCHPSFSKRRSFPHLRECWNYTTSLCEEGTWNRTALVSYPGSGNTWLRHLIEIATGVFTGSVYFDETLYSKGFLGEREDWRSGSTIVQKLHDKFVKGHHFKRAILLIRDPIAASRSFVDYLESGHTGWASPITFARKEWPMFLLHSTHDWISLAKSWLEADVDLLVIHYENLINSTSKEVRKICNFLQYNDSRTYTTCFDKHIEGSFHRKLPLWKIPVPLPPKVRGLIDDGVDYLNHLLVQHGKDAIPLHKYQYYRKQPGRNTTRSNQTELSLEMVKRE